jgi:hypothetical protein
LRAARFWSASRSWCSTTDKNLSRGRFGMYVPPLMEALGLTEVRHNPKNNRMRAI